MRFTTTLVTGPTTMTLMLEKIYPNNVPDMNWGRVAIDTEYYVDERRQYHLAYVQISNGKEVYVIDGKLTSAAKECEYDLPKRLIPWITDERVKKYVSTLRADDTAFLSAYGVSIAGCVADTESMDWLCDENRRSHGLKDGAQDHCDIFMRDFAEVFGYHESKKDGTPKKKRTRPNMRQIVEGSDGGHNVPWTGEEGRAKAVEYAALDPYATYQMAVTLRTRLEKLGLWDWYQGVELPLGRTLIEMERRGIRIDAKSVAHIRREVAADLLRCQHYIRQVADEPTLNLRSNPQMQKLLFEKLKWPVVAYNDLTDAQEREGEDEGNPSLNKAALDEYVKKGFGLASHLIFHRSRSTLHNNFLTGVLEKRDSATDLVHTVFKQNRTVTGRLASGDRIQRLMNLQNVPSKKDKDPYQLRQFFLPTKPGYSLVVGDYAQVELYVIAQISGDKRMIAAFNRGEDLHMLTCAKIFDLKLPPEPKVWKVTSVGYQKWVAACDEWKAQYKGQRDKAKIVNFGLNYGMSAFKLSKDHDMPLSEAEAWVAGYFELYPGVRHYMERTIAQCHRSGYVTTIARRRRTLPDIHDADPQLVGRAERQCINAPIQGSVADIIKVAMNAIEIGPTYINEWFPSSMKPLTRLKKMGLEMLLQVHDELICQVPSEYAEQAAKDVNKVMCAPFPDFFRDVRLTASVHAGPNWLEAKK